MELSKDDWELTLKQMKSQRVEHTLSLSIIEAGIRHVEQKLKLLEANKKNDTGK